MNTKATSVVAVCVLVCAAAFEQARAQTPQAPLTDTIAPDIPGVVAGGTKVEVIKEFEGADGPIAHPDGSVIFAEPQPSRIIKIDKDNVVSTFLEHTNRSHALAFDAKGRLISLQETPDPDTIAVLYPKGSETVLADNFDGKPFGRPNDLVVNKAGGLYFTDPGPNAQPGSPPPPLPPAVYYLPPGGKPIKVADVQGRPNGITLSIDETILYVNNTYGEYMLAFDVQGDGTLQNRRQFAKYEGITMTANGLAGGADGLTIDAAGRLYAATPLGVQVFSPAGKHLGTIALSRAPQNMAFAGPEKKTLYVVGRGTVFKVQMLAQGPAGRVK